MECLLLDTNFVAVGVIDEYVSFIWTDRYASAGDFELYLPASIPAIRAYQDDFYIWSPESEHLMIVEDVDLTTDEESGTFLKVTGRSYESVLDRRVVWYPTILTGNLQAGIAKVINENVANPINGTRKMPGITFKNSTDPRITSLTLEQNLRGENVYQLIMDVCLVFDLGFRIVMTTNGNFEFELYAGLDRSFDQTANPRVIFSPNFDNLANSNYHRSTRTNKTTALTEYDGVESGEKLYTNVDKVALGSGLTRREMFTSVTGVPREVDEVPLTEAQYLAQIKQKASETLAENFAVSLFDGEITESQTFAYLTHFGMGDVVQIENEYGLTSKSRVTEFIRSDATTGKTAYPTLQSVVP